VAATESVVTVIGPPPASTPESPLDTAEIARLMRELEAVVGVIAWKEARIRATALDQDGLVVFLPRSRFAGTDGGLLRAMPIREHDGDAIYIGIRCD
jgi:hypothetical protein